eukprot:CAMPEP_0198204652 /NCGR_PEP_ID=MMETSP1445-20131203/8070_1 /TAXON_ID=36898 /ORGANISM="Pyramimonas sp., Strain CCMP2087" /LENGTH=322 /DNA_ID=CAMNT_0043876621 /DNA_START=530 /DNA_END=1495 /DNA_ORIENTATION=+
MQQDMQQVYQQGIQQDPTTRSYDICTKKTYTGGDLRGYRQRHKQSKNDYDATQVATLNNVLTGVFYNTHQLTWDHPTLHSMNESQEDSMDTESLQEIGSERTEHSLTFLIKCTQAMLMILLCLLQGMVLCDMRNVQVTGQATSGSLRRSLLSKKLNFLFLLKCVQVVSIILLYLLQSTVQFDVRDMQVADQETMGSSRHPLYERWPGGSTTAKVRASHRKKKWVNYGATRRPIGTLAHVRRVFRYHDSLRQIREIFQGRRAQKAGGEVQGDLAEQINEILQRGAQQAGRGEGDKRKGKEVVQERDTTHQDDSATRGPMGTLA